MILAGGLNPGGLAQKRGFIEQDLLSKLIPLNNDSQISGSALLSPHYFSANDRSQSRHKLPNDRRIPSDLLPRIPDKLKHQSKPDSRC